MNAFINAIHAISPISQKAADALGNSVSFITVKKNTHILEPGQIAKNIYFIDKGIARAYYFFDGMDVTDYFAVESHFIGAVESLFTGAPSNKGIQVLEDSDLYFIPYSEFEKLCDVHHEIERAGRKIAIFAMLEEQRRIESIRFHESKQRYIELNQKYPGLVNRCPLKHIASYLGITQVSLSRLRAEL